MAVDERCVEIEAYRGFAFLKVVVTPVFLVGAAAALRSAQIDTAGTVFVSIVALLAVVVLVMNLWLLARRPLALRATPAGLWFGGGPILPWSEVRTMYSAPISPRNPPLSTVISRGIRFEFRHRRTTLRLPPRYWFSAGLSFEVAVLTYHLDAPPDALIARLEAFRTAACGTEDGVIVGATQPPAARVVRRG